MSILNYATSYSEVENPSGTIAGTTSGVSPDVSEAIDLYQTASFDLTFTGQSDLWISFYVRVNNDNSKESPALTLYNGTDPLIRLDTNNKSSNIEWQLETYNGSTWTAAVTGLSNIYEHTTYRIDIHVIFNDTTGEITIYKDNVQDGTFSGDTITNGAIGTCDKVTFSGMESTWANNTYYSAIMIADEDTRTIRYIQDTINAVGTHNDFTGAYTSVDSTGIDDINFMSGNSGQKQTFTKGAGPTAYATGYDVIAVGVSARLKRGGAGAASHQLMVREGTTDGLGTSTSSPESFTNHKALFTTNPDTSAAWTYAEADAAEVGVSIV